MDGLTRRQKRKKIANAEDASALIQQKAAAHSLKSSLKPKKITQLKPSQDSNNASNKQSSKKRKKFDSEMVVKKQKTPNHFTAKNKKKMKR